ncbi:MAG: OmpH family outer membrane protein [candidate division NC10 bacterium]
MMRGFSKTLTLVVLAVIFVGANATPLRAQEGKIGLFDLQRVIVQSKRGQEVLAKLQTEREAKQREIDAEEKKIRKMEADLEKQRSVLSALAVQEREKAIGNLARDLRRIVNDFNREFGERERGLRGQLLNEIAAVVRSYGKENGYLLIMEVRAGGVMYGNEAADVTKGVVAAYDASAASGKK